MDYNELLHLRNAERVGIMGGTFDPIHLGHLVTAEAARSGFNMDKVVFVPVSYTHLLSASKITTASYFLGILKSLLKNHSKA